MLNTSGHPQMMALQEGRPCLSPDLPGRAPPSIFRHSRFQRLHRCERLS